MGSWLFQSMPERFRLIDFMSTTPERALWRVYNSGNRMLIGDTVYIWQGLGKVESPLSGIFARGTIMKCPRRREDYEASASFWVDPADALRLMDRVLVSIAACSTTPVISRHNFETDTILAKCKILTVRTGSNFSLSPEQSSRIELLYI